MEPPPAPAEAADPWHWSINAVIDHLCGPNGVLSSAGAAVSLGVQGLAQSLLINETTGEDLLRDVGPADLVNDFGVQSRGLRRRVIDAIAALRARSPSYVQWVAEQGDSRVAKLDHVASAFPGSVGPGRMWSVTPSTTTPLPTIEGPPRAFPQTPRMLTLPSAEANGVPLTNGVSPPLSFNAVTPGAESAKRALSPQRKDLDGRAPTDDMAVHGNTSETAAVDAQQTGSFVTDASGKKRRKLAPSALQTVVPGPARDQSPTPVRRAASPIKDQTSPDTERPGYLGLKAFPVERLFYGATRIGEPVNHEVILKSAEEKAISGDWMPLVADQGRNVSSNLPLDLSAVFSSKSLPTAAGPGRRQYVAARMKYFLLHNNARTPIQFGRSAERTAGILPYPRRLLKHVAEEIDPSVTIVVEEDAIRVPRTDWPPNAHADEASVAVGPSARQQPEGPADEFAYLDKYIALGEAEGTEDLFSVDGHSDSESFDSLTRHEIEEEAAERAAAAALRLTAEQAKAVVEEKCAEIALAWREKHVPRLEAGGDAFRLWKNAHVHRSVGFMLQKAREKTAELETRQSKQAEAILRDSWKRAEDLRAQCSNMEFTIADVERKRWETDVLERHEPPPQLRKGQIKKVAKTPKRSVEDEADDVEVIETDEEDDFVIEEEAAGAVMLDEHLLPVPEISRAPASVNEIPPEEVVPPAPEDPVTTESPSVEDAPMEDAPPAAPEDEVNWAAADDDLAADLVDLSGDRVEVDGQRLYPELPHLERSEGPRRKNVFDVPSSPVLRPITPATLTDGLNSGELDPSDDSDSGSPVVAEDSDDSILSKRPTARTADIIDLTMTSDAVPAGDASDQQDEDEEEDFQDAHSDLEVRLKQEPSTQKGSAWPDVHDLIGLKNLTVADADKLVEQGERLRLLTWVVARSKAEARESAHQVMEGLSADVAIFTVKESLEQLAKHSQRVRRLSDPVSEGFMQLSFWFVIWNSCRLPPPNRGLPLDNVEAATSVVIEDSDRFCDYYVHLAHILFQCREEEKPKPAKRDKPFALKTADASTGDDEAFAYWSNPAYLKKTKTGKKKVRQVQESQEGIDLRKSAQERAQERQRRSDTLRRRFAKSLAQAESSDPAIINLSKADGEDHIFLDAHIANRIHRHQLEGVQFMWGEAVVAHEGCLLAHTMGLGKTMQCVTLLASLASAAVDANERISKQVLGSFHPLYALILCPPALVENWSDELLMWWPPTSPFDVRRMRKITKDLSFGERIFELEEWAEEGGILLMPYTVFSMLVHNKSRGKDATEMNEETHEKVQRILLKQPNIVIADEAHYFKNKDSKTSKAVCQIEVKSRIALTGSPLSNHLEEYFSILNWAVEGYLGDLAEFNAKFVRPITDGMYIESTGSERRLALRRLKVLKDDLKPKVNRADYSVIRNQMAGKCEFIIRLPLTDLQQQCYDTFISSIRSANIERSQANLWACLALLTLLCAHPQCYYEKLLDSGQTNEYNKKKKKKAASLKAVKAIDGDDEELEAEVDDLLSQSTRALSLNPQMLEDSKQLLKAQGKGLQSVSLSTKMDMLMQLIGYAKEAGDKTLVFTDRLPVIAYVETVLKACGVRFMKIDGMTDPNTRSRSTKEFADGKASVMLVSTRAGGTGLNLQAANRVILLDYHFNPMIEQQAIGRAYRIGQLKQVFVYRLVIGGSFEESLLNLGLFKTQLAGRVVDKKDFIPQAKRDFSQYLQPRVDSPLESLQKFKEEDADPLVLSRVLADEGDDQRAIRSIKLTDAFMVEDKEELTPEEQEEADKELKEMIFRRKNPEAYRRMQLQERRPQLERWAPVTGYRVPNGPSVTPSAADLAVAAGNPGLDTNMLASLSADATGQDKNPAQSPLGPARLGGPSDRSPAPHPLVQAQTTDPLAAIGPVQHSIGSPGAETQTRTAPSQSSAPPAAAASNATGPARRNFGRRYDGMMTSLNGTASSAEADEKMGRISQSQREETRIMLQRTFEGWAKKAPNIRDELASYSAQLATKLENTVFRRGNSWGTYRANSNALALDLFKSDALLKYLQRVAGEDRENSVISIEPSGGWIAPNPQQDRSRATSASPKQAHGPPASASPAVRSTPNQATISHAPPDVQAVESDSGDQVRHPMQPDDAAKLQSAKVPDSTALPKKVHDALRAPRRPVRGSSADLATLSNESNAQMPAFPLGALGNGAPPQSNDFNAPLRPPRRAAPPAKSQAPVSTQPRIKQEPSRPQQQDRPSSNNSFEVRDRSFHYAH